MDQNKKDKLNHIILNKLITKGDNGDPENQLFVIYDNLITSINTPDARDIKNHGTFVYLLDALRVPVLSIEVSNTLYF